jgi:hypothetical protein
MKNGQLTRLPRRRIFRAYQLSGFRLNQRTGACSVGESEFMGSKAPSGRGVHNFGIPIHNLWDEKIRNLWDSSIIYGTASQSDPCLAGPR